MRQRLKEIVLYLFFGVLTTLINIVSFYILNNLFGVYYLLANALAWLLSVTFAYFTNRRWVFESKDARIVNEFAKFVSCRLFSGMCDMIIMFLGVDILGGSSFITKLLTNVVVVVLNYIFSKRIIFKKERVMRGDDTNVNM